MNNVIDAFVATGLVSFPLYLGYWIVFQVRRRTARRLWAGLAAFAIWCAATWFCFIRLMIQCMAGGCAEKVSPFLEYAILYAVTSVVLIGLMHRLRAT
jgi:hypothetical protein